MLSRRYGAQVGAMKAIELAAESLAVGIYTHDQRESTFVAPISRIVQL
jgi:hypothetical protein